MQRARRAVLGLLPGLIAFMPQPAASDWSRESWSMLQGGAYGRGAAVCHSDDESGSLVCFALRCRGNGPAEFAVMAYGDDNVAPYPMAVVVDDTHRSVLTMVPAPGGEMPTDVATLDPVAHAPLLQALQSGRFFTIRPQRDPIPFSLRGSSAAINRAMQLCPVAAPQPAPAPPVATAPAAPALPAFPAPPPPAAALPMIAPPPVDGAVDALALREQILDRRITWGDGAASVTFRPGGRFEAEQNGHAVSGNWQMVTDGRICWTDGTAQGCFRFLERGAAGLALRLENAAGRADLGPIRFE